MLLYFPPEAKNRLLALKSIDDTLP